MARTKAKIHPSIKAALRAGRIPDGEFLRIWRRRAALVCKPCWELRYCPYGPLVEDFPFLPGLRAESVEHNEYLKRCLATGRVGDDGERKLDPAKRRSFKQSVAAFRPSSCPEFIPAVIASLACTNFGHICPVYFAAEGFTETAERRRRGRYIPFKTKMRVVRRDNYTCQHCGKHLKDQEVEFDHIIPLAKGGSSEEHNIRLTCFDCNRDKSDRVEV